MVCNAENLNKLLCFRLPIAYGLSFEWFTIFPANDSFICVSTNAVV